MSLFAGFFLFSPEKYKRQEGIACQCFVEKAFSRISSKNLLFVEGIQLATFRALGKSFSFKASSKMCISSCSLRSELTSKFSSDDGIKELMSDLIIHKAAEVIPFQVRVTKKEGMYNPGDTRPTNNMEAAELGSLLTPGINLPSSVVSALMTDIDSIPKVVAPIFNKHMIDIFGQQEGGGVLTLDESKLTKENIEIFNKRVNADLEAIPVREIVANAVVRDAIKKLSKKNLLDFSNHYLINSFYRWNRFNFIS